MPKSPAKRVGTVLAVMCSPYGISMRQSAFNQHRAISPKLQKLTRICYNMIGSSFLVYATIQSSDAKGSFSAIAPASAVHPYIGICLGLSGLSISFTHFFEKRETGKTLHPIHNSLDKCHFIL